MILEPLDTFFTASAAMSLDMQPWHRFQGMHQNFINILRFSHRRDTPADRLTGERRVKNDQPTKGWDPQDSTMVKHGLPHFTLIKVVACWVPSDG